MECVALEHHAGRGCPSPPGGCLHRFPDICILGRILDCICGEQVSNTAPLDAFQLSVDVAIAPIIRNIGLATHLLLIDARQLAGVMAAQCLHLIICVHAGCKRFYSAGVQCAGQCDEPGWRHLLHVLLLTSAFHVLPFAALAGLAPASARWRMFDHAWRPCTAGVDHG